MASTVPNSPVHNLADAPAAIATAVCLAVFGIAFFNGSPVIVGAWAQSGFTEQQAGWLASSDNAGMVLASFFVAFFVNRVNRRGLAVVGIGFGVLANMLAIPVSSFEVLLPLRILSGFGGGVIYALGIASLAASSQTARNFSILLFVQVSMGIVEINGIPLLYSGAGLAGIYIALAAALGLGALSLPWLPARLVDVVVTSVDHHVTLPRFWLWGCLICVFLLYIGIGNFWTYIERVGNAAGLSQSYITQALTWTQLLSLISCLLAAWLSSRIGQLRPLMISLAITALVMYVLVGPVSPLVFVTALAMFFMVWSPNDIYQLGTLGELDPSGRFPAMLPAFQGIALAVGPALGATLLGEDGRYDLVFMLSGFCALLALGFYLLLFRRIRVFESCLTRGTTAKDVALQ